MSSRNVHTPQAPGLRLIIAYKLLKAPLMMALALWLTVWPTGAYHFGESIAEELSAAGSIWFRLGEWLSVHLSERLVTRGGVLAWLDAATTLLEAILLLLRKSWAEWVVTLGLAALLPLELVSLRHRPGIGKICVLIINAAVVGYLARRRLRA